MTGNIIMGKFSKAEEHQEQECWAAMREGKTERSQALAFEWVCKVYYKFQTLS